MATDQSELLPVTGVKSVLLSVHQQGTYDPRGTITPFDDELPDIEDDPAPSLSLDVARKQMAPSVRYRLCNRLLVSAMFVADVVSIIARNAGIQLTDMEAAGLIVHTGQAESIVVPGWVTLGAERVLLNTLAWMLIHRPWPEADAPPVGFLQELQGRARALGIRVAPAQ